MKQVILAGSPPIELNLRQNPRARRISLRVSRLDGRVSVTLPPGGDTGHAVDFARSREGWIRRQLEAGAQTIRPHMDGKILFEGRDVSVELAAVRSVSFGEGRFVVPNGSGRSGARLAAHLKCLARERLARACDMHAAALGRPYRRLTLRDTRSRWGSCTTDGNLMFSWRLIMAPPAVLDYVAAHEVAHLAEMNHSAAFWHIVGELAPGYKDPRGWLRQNGARLHGYRFTD